jgi:hypothetical protein
VSKECTCTEEMQKQAMAHVATCEECTHDADDGSINPCPEFFRLFMEDCSGMKDRCCAVWPDGRFQHYDFQPAEEEL